MRGGQAEKQGGALPADIRKIIMENDKKYREND